MTHTSKGDVTFVVRLISLRDIALKNIEMLVYDLEYSQHSLDDLIL